MYDSEVLEFIVDCYVTDCRTNHKRLTKKGLAELLDTTPRTLHRVLRGSYAKGRPYNDHREHPNRIIANNDFPLVRKVFDGSIGEYTNT